MKRIILFAGLCIVLASCKKEPIHGSATAAPDLTKIAAELGVNVKYIHQLSTATVDLIKVQSAAELQYLIRSRTGTLRN